MMKLLLLLVLVVALAAARAGAFFSHGPKVHGDSFKYRGDGNVPQDPLDWFHPDDSYTDITLDDWDLNDVATFNLPHTVRTLTITKCNLEKIPDELRALENLLELNLAGNRLEVFDGLFAASNVIAKLNVSHNALTNYSSSLPSLTMLDLSSNALSAFPNAVFASSQLDSFRISDNQFEIAAVSTAQYDFFAGLSDFQAGFADVSSCAAGSLVYLQGEGICRLDVAAAEDPAIAMRAHGANQEDTPPTPMATVGVLIPSLPVSGNSTKKYIVAAIIVLVVVGAIVGIIALISLGVVGGVARAVYDYISNWRQKRHREGLHEETPLFFDQAARASYQKEIEAVDRLFPSNDPVLVTWRIDYDSVTLVKKIAQGAFGEVWVGQYRNSRVAVKRLLPDQVSVATSEAFLREIKLMAWLEHPKVVQFVGVAWTKLIDMLAVIEYMDSGDLRTFLDKKSPKRLPWQEGGLKLQYALDTIDAIVYLHSLSPVIIHRDLKSRNILLDSKKGAKLGDFGVSATKRPGDMTAGVGTARWLAPEIARGEEKYTEAVDVYSFGIILSELDTHQLPFADIKLNDMAILQGVSSGKLQVSFSETCPQNLLTLARSCMSLDPAERPPAAKIAYELRKAELLL